MGKTEDVVCDDYFHFNNKRINFDFASISRFSILSCILVFVSSVIFRIIVVFHNCLFYLLKSILVFIELVHQCHLLLQFLLKPESVYVSTLRYDLGWI